MILNSDESKFLPQIAGSC